MEVVNERCCGLDVYKQTVVACVIVPMFRPPAKLRGPHLRHMTADRLELADWLGACQVTHVDMESTGVYWKPIVRHEALFDREGMKGPLPRAVAAVR